MQTMSSMWEIADKRMKGNGFGDQNIDTPEALWEVAMEYFRDVRNNDRRNPQLTKDGDKTDLPLVRPFTINGLCIYLGITSEKWRDIRSPVSANFREDLSTVISKIEDIIHNDKYEGAATNQYNSNVMVRDLGLAEKTELTGGDGGPMEVMNADVRTFTSRISRIQSRVAERGDGEAGQQDEG